MRPPYENPAQRLNVILGLLRAQSQQRAVRRAWADVLGIAAEDNPALIMGVASTIDLFNRVESRVAQSQPSALRSRWIEPVRKALGELANLDSPLSLASQYIDDATRLSLSACEELFPPSDDDPSEVTDERLQRASRLADDLLDELAAAGLDPAAHELLVRHVLALQNAIKLFRVVGNSGLYDAILSTNAALIVSVDEDATKQPWYTKVRERIGMIADVMTIVTATGTSVSAISGMISPQ